MADPKQQPGPSSDQLRGADGTCETVTVGGVRMNKHEYNEETHGPADKGSGRKTGGASKDDFEEMTVPELQENLSRRGIEYTSEDRKDDLVKKARKGK